MAVLDPIKVVITNFPGQVRSFLPLQIQTALYFYVSGQDKNLGPWYKR